MAKMMPNVTNDHRAIFFSVIAPGGLIVILFRNRYSVHLVGNGLLLLLGAGSCSSFHRGTLCSLSMWSLTGQ